MPRDSRDYRRSRSRSVERRRKRSQSPERRSRRDYEERRRSRSRDEERSRRRSRSRSADRRKKSKRDRSPKRDVKKELDSIPLRERRRLLSISSTSSEDEKKFDDQVEALRQEKAQKRTAQRQKLKDTETPEEKRIRRLAKKMKKEEGRKMESLSSSIAYNNLNNPFNDTNLTDPFVWKKKMEREGTKPGTKKELDEMHHDKVRRNLKEMEELRRNRQARQDAREESEKAARDKEKEMFGDYTKIEYDFHIKQARERTKIRIKENRPKAIDLLARYSVFGIAGEEEDYGEFELVDPLQYVQNLSIDDFEDLIADIKSYKQIATFKDDAFWDDMKSICEGELDKLKDIRKRREMDEAVHSSVRDDVLKKFTGKSYQQLTEMQRTLKDTIQKNPENGFYQAVLDQLLPYMARQQLKERHREKMALKLKRIREEQAREMDEYHRQFGDVKPVSAVQSKEEMAVDDSEIEVTEEDAAAIQNQVVKPIPFTLEALLESAEEQQEQQWASLSEAQLKFFTQKNYESGRYSPLLDANAMPGIEVIDEDDDKKQLAKLRNQDQSANPMTAEESKLLQTFGGIEKDEENFNDEVVEKQTYLWSDKYRPRKPKYLNRVHTGFDWNKYNQTHYDLDNPPPKIVQGYRFNIFYPDLLDVTQTPQYTITECEDNDFAILKFKSGPPYEDIAFKIVNREWEINHKHGFKNQFKDGVFQLWFFFKRYRYRR